MPIFREAQTHRAGQGAAETSVERGVRGGFSGCGRSEPSREFRGWCALRGAGAGGSGDQHRSAAAPVLPPLPDYPKLPPAPPGERTTDTSRRRLDPPAPGAGTPGTRYRPPTRPLGHFSHRTSPLSRTTGFRGPAATALQNHPHPSNRDKPAGSGTRTDPLATWAPKESTPTTHKQQHQARIRHPSAEEQAISSIFHTTICFHTYQYYENRGYVSFC